MSSFFYLMAMFPDAQTQAQAEIEEVIGAGRLPTLEDIDSLPYVRALIKEVIRWGPVAPLGECSLYPELRRGTYPGGPTRS